MSGFRVTKLTGSVLVAMVLAACSASPAATNTPGAPTAAATAAATAAPTEAASAAASGPTVAGIAFPQPEQTAVSICESAISTGSMPIYYIEEHHLDQQWGMSVTYQEFEGNGPCSQALVAGQVDVADLSGQSLSLQLTDAPTTDTYVIQNSATYILVCQASITDAASLTGKSIAVSSFGSFSYAQALLALQSLRLTTDDVTITAVGGHSGAARRIEGGAVGCDSEDHNQAEPLTAQGYNVLVDLSKVQTAGYVGLALEEPNSYIDANPNTSLALVAMYAQGAAQFLNDDPANAAAIWAKYSRGRSMTPRTTSTTCCHSAGTGRWQVQRRYVRLHETSHDRRRSAYRRCRPDQGLHRSVHQPAGSDGLLLGDQSAGLLAESDLNSRVADCKAAPGLPCSPPLVTSPGRAGRRAARSGIGR